MFAHPLVALPAWAINFYVWHLPVLYQAALRHDLVHGLQHACFLGFGIAMWMALLGPLPKPAWFGNAARLVYIIAVRLAGTILANIMIFSGTVLYPIYRAGDAHWHISPMGDQIAAAGVMMVEESLLTIGLFCWLFLKVAREAEERQRSSTPPPRRARARRAAGRAGGRRRTGRRAARADPRPGRHDHGFLRGCGGALGVRADGHRDPGMHNLTIEPARREHGRARMWGTRPRPRSPAGVSNGSSCRSAATAIVPTAIPSAPGRPTVRSAPQRRPRAVPGRVPRPPRAVRRARSAAARRPPAAPR